jgi:hypothetical protein
MDVGGPRQNEDVEDLVEQLEELVARAAEVIGEVTARSGLHHASDTALAAAMAFAGDLARRAEGALIEGVAEIEERSRMRDLDARLTTRLGCHNVNELVQRLTRCCAATASRLIRAQRAVALEWDPISGGSRPAMLPALRSALLEEHAGLDGVLAVSGPLLDMRDRVRREQVLLADELLAEHARGEGPDGGPPATADILRVHAQAWAIALDEDGAEPRDRDAAFQRGLTLGRIRNGVIPVRGDLLPDVAAQLERIVVATSSPNARRVRFVDGGDDDEAQDAGILDDRSPAQRRHDALALALDVAARSAELPTVGGAAPTLVVAIRADDLVSDHGWATAEGTDEPVSLAVARHVGCSGVVQRVALGNHGRILRLGAEERVFNRHQRRAIALRDGGCIIPGCGVPAGWCQIHHVVDHAKGGPTHTDNGVLLCWWHHRFIDTGPWKIRMNRGVPEVQAPMWFDRSGRWRTAARSRIRMVELIGRRT